MLPVVHFQFFLSPDPNLQYVAKARHLEKGFHGAFFQHETKKNDNECHQRPE